MDFREEGFGVWGEEDEDKENYSGCEEKFGEEREGLAMVAIGKH